MPIKIPNDLPAVQTLADENIFVMTETRAITQDIRPLKILLLNLMPKKIETETQLSRLLGNTPLQIDLELIKVNRITIVEDENKVDTLEGINTRFIINENYTETEDEPNGQADGTN